MAVNWFVVQCNLIYIVELSIDTIVSSMVFNFLFDSAAICRSTYESRSSASPSVIVIGAGFAGIAAARALYDASFQVVLLESRDRIGGRVHTDYSFGFPVDLGASW